MNLEISSCVWLHTCLVPTCPTTSLFANVSNRDGTGYEWRKRHYCIEMLCRKPVTLTAQTASIRTNTVNGPTTFKKGPIMLKLGRHFCSAENHMHTLQENMHISTVDQSQGILTNYLCKFPIFSLFITKMTYKLHVVCILWPTAYV